MADSFRFPPKLGVANSIKKEMAEASAPIFENKIFYLLEDPLTEGFVQFNVSELSVLIAGQAGQLLTQATKEALIHDKETRDSVAVHVVRWGNSKTDSFLDEMIQNRNACTLIEVTPIWLTVCIEMRSWVAPDKFARLFQPVGTPWRRIDDSATRLSITGFNGAERIALAHFIKALGVTYDDAMSKSTLYLICAKKSGPKYEKAIEWNIKLVDVDWLYELAHG
jgi:NAD-dependent DNA ligase